MRDIRCMVVREAVADRRPAVLEANLFDLDQRCADVVSRPTPSRTFADFRGHDEAHGALASSGWDRANGRRSG